MILKRKQIEKLYEITEKNEQWSTIPDFDNYLVSDLGKVFSIVKANIMVGEETEKGYLRVPLRNENGIKKVRVHRLVAETFLPNPENKVQVDHKNGVKIDNRLINLRWLSDVENKQAAIEKGCKKTSTNQSAQYRLKKRREKFEEKRVEELQKIRGEI